MASHKEVTRVNSDGRNSVEAKRVNEKEQTYLDIESAGIKNPATSSGKQVKTSRQKAIAQLDLFLNDISETTEKVKKEEEKKLQSDNTKLALTEENLKLHGKISSRDLPRSWNSLQSVVSDDIGDGGALTPPLMSSDDFRSLGEDESTTRAKIDRQQHNKEIVSGKGTTYSIASVSSQGSESSAPSTYGLQHLNHLRIFLEQYDQLQQQNTELTKRVSNLEVGKTTRPPSIGVDMQTNSLKKPSGKKKPVQRYSTSFLAPTNVTLPKKGKVGKSRPSKAKYLSTLLFPSAAKSVGDLKQSSSQNLDKIGSKTYMDTPTHNYAVDDMELRKSPVANEAPWINSNVKESLKRKHFSRLDYIDPAEVSYDCVDGLVPESPTIIVSDEPVPSNIEPTQSILMQEHRTHQNDDYMENGAKLRNKENYRNTVKMTEWAFLQQAFPVVRVDSSLDFLSHLGNMLGHSKDQKKSSYFPSLKIGSGRSKNSSAPNKNANMFLPQAETQDFSTVFHAAHAMSNQLTLTMSESEIEMLSTDINSDLRNHRSPAVSIT